MAAAAVRGLSARRASGEGSLVRVSLARIAALLTSIAAPSDTPALTKRDDGDYAATGRGDHMRPARRLRPPVKVEADGDAWIFPLARWAPREASDDISSALCCQGKQKIRPRDRRRVAARRVPFVRSDLSIISHAARIRARPPANQSLGRAVTCIGDQARRSDFELFGGAVEHRLGRADFGLANGRRRLDVHNHRRLEIDEIVVGIGVDRRLVGRGCVAGRWIGRRDRLRLDRRRFAEGRVIEDRRYSATCDSRSDRGLRPCERPRLRCASATIMLASTAKASPPHDPFLHPALHHRLEQLAQQIALAETAVAVL